MLVSGAGLELRLSVSVSSAFSAEFVSPFFVAALCFLFFCLGALSVCKVEKNQVPQTVVKKVI